MNTTIYPYVFQALLLGLLTTIPAIGQNLIEGSHHHLKILSQNSAERYIFLDQECGCFELEVCGLELNRQYSFSASFSYTPDLFDLKVLEGAKRINFDEGKNLFLTLSDCIRFEACINRDKSNQIPILSFSILENKSNFGQSPRTVQGRSGSSIEWGNFLSSSELVNNYLMDTNYFHLVNIQPIGPGQGRGSFFNGKNSIGIDEGVVLSTGHLRTIEGPNQSPQSGSNLGGHGDVDLFQLSNLPIFDAVGLQIDFTPMTDSFKIRYVFASEEYCQFVGMGFNDVMGIFLSGPGIDGPFTNGAVNLAVIPHTDQFVSVDNLNHTVNADFYIDNTPAGQLQTTGNAVICGSLLDQDGFAIDLIEFDGFSVVMEIGAKVISSETYRLKIIVGDAFDASFDSAIFLDRIEAMVESDEVSEIYNSKTGRTWMDRNLGADRVAYISRDVVSFGDLYQWGRGADGHQFRNSKTLDEFSNEDQPGHGKFITTNSQPHDWRNSANDDLWQGESGVNNPCPSGFRLPTIEEWEEEIESWASRDLQAAFNSPLKLTATGSRSSSGELFRTGKTAYYWSSTVSSERVQSVAIYPNFAITREANKSSGLAVRCIKDEEQEMTEFEFHELHSFLEEDPDLKIKDKADFRGPGLLTEEKNHLTSNRLKLFPNPGTGHFKVDLNSLAEYHPGKVIVTNAVGNSVIKHTIEKLNFRIDLSGQGPGLYFIHILNAEGLVLESGKLIKL